ncbi:MAG: hypothetical protein HY298_26945 [Verrucomicrobia bacterium]|nr:hypothetical protein [Verrucomicrobiota bacterium]
MRLSIYIGLLMLATSCSTSNPSAKNSRDPEVGSEEKPVWFWFAGDGPQMSLQVRLDQKIIYETKFPIRHAKRSSAYSKGQEKAIHYSFTSARAIVWQGYKDADETTAANQKILGDIWLAGADPDCLILGIAFGGQDSNYMNTLHIAHPNQRDESTIASGLVIFTAPIEGKKTKASKIPR